MSVDNLIAFTATEFHAALVTPFFINFTQRILIEGYNLCTSMTPMLLATSQTHLARHTDLVYMQLKKETSLVHSTLYMFTHPKWRPWGNHLPISCPSCASPHSWSDLTKTQSTYNYSCKRTGCSGWCSFSKPDDFSPCKSEPEVNGGCWIKKEYKV